MLNGIASNPQPPFDSNLSFVHFDHLLYQTHVIDLDVCVLIQSAIGCGEHCVLKSSVCVAWLVCGNGIFIKGKRGVALLPFSVVLYVPDFVFLNVLRLRHLETSFCSCLRLLCQPWDFCNLNLICQNKICSEIVASYPRVRACLTSVTVRLSRFFPNSFASITMVFGPYSKR